MAFNLSSEEIASSLEQPEEFELPDNWKNIELPASDLTISIPDDWTTEFYGDENQFVRLNNSDETLEVYGGFISDEMNDIESDAGRLFSLQTFLETSDYDYYNEYSANIEVHSLNKAYVVEYSVREDSGDDIEDRIIAYIFTPVEEFIILFGETTRDEFAQIDLLEIREIFGSIRK